jgi:hypothetical protein
MNHLPPRPGSNIRVISIFFFKFPEIFAGQAPTVSTTPVANLTPVPLVSLIPAANYTLERRQGTTGIEVGCCLHQEPRVVVTKYV